MGNKILLKWYQWRFATLKKSPKIIGISFVIGILLLPNFLPFISPHQALAHGAGLSISKLGRNITKGETNWTDTIYADPGDEIEFYIKINSTDPGTSQNISVKDILPYKLNYVPGSTTGATTFDITSGWRDIGNIPTNSSKDIYFKARLEDSSRFRTIGSTTLINTVRASTWSAWMVSDTTNIIVNNEKNSEQNSEQKISPALYISKTGRNITKRDNFWAEKIQAEPGDEIEFFIEITSTGNRPAEDVYVRDYLPYKLKYTDNSTSGATFYNITNGWYNIGDIIVGTARTIYFKAKLADEKSFSTGSTTLKNNIRVYADSIKTISDGAEIIVTKGQVLGTSTTGSDNELTMNISKLVRNVSAGQIGFRESTAAKTEEIIEFSINIVNSGYAPVEKIKIWDTLPLGLNYLDDSCYLDNIKVGDGIAGAGLIVDTLPVRGSKIIKFQAKVASADNFNNRTTNLTNYIYVNAKGISDISDKASITITVDKNYTTNKNNTTTSESGGKVLGATTIQTGQTEALVLSLLISFLISIAIYFIVAREEKVKKMAQVP